MRSNRAVWGLVVLLVLTVSVVSACGGATPEPAQPTQESEPTATPQPVEPTEAPTEVPQEEPTRAPTEVPPTEAPTEAPPTETPTQAPPTEAPTEEPVSIDAQALLEGRCTECHALGRTTSASKSREQWERTVVRMVGYGAVLNDEEQAALIDYLVENYGP